jgi:hypothetical protein
MDAEQILNARVILVKCTYVIPVRFPAHWTDDMIRFEVEENGCPGTGFTGAAFEAHYENQKERSMCWACTLADSANVIVGEREPTQL